MTLAPQSPLSGLQSRLQRAAADFDEALSVMAPAQPKQPTPPALAPHAPQQPAPQSGALMQRSPLQATSSFKSPPVEAALQGPRGVESLAVPPPSTGLGR